MTYFFIRHSERSEESHRRTDGYMYFFTLVVGYFACAQYDVLFLYVILNGSEESHRRTDGYMYFFTLVVGYFACAQYDVLFYTSFCQCQVSKLACKGLRTKIFIRRRHFAKMQNDSFKMRQHYAPYNRSEESHRKSTAVYALSLWLWDISLMLNMTYYCFLLRGRFPR